MNKKVILIKKIIMASISAIVVGLLSWYGISFGIFNQSNYFFDHFLACVSLVGIGIIALVLVYGEGTRFSGNKNQESVMTIVGFGLIILGIISIVFSYVL